MCTCDSWVAILIISNLSCNVAQTALYCVNQFLTNMNYYCSFFFSDNLCFSLFVGMIMYANEVETKKE